MSLLVLLAAVFTVSYADNSATVQMTKLHEWSGNFEGHFILPINDGDLIGWEAIIKFSGPVTNIRQYVGTVKRSSKDNTLILMINKPDKGIVKQGGSLDIQIGGNYAGSTPLTATADIVDLSHDTQTVPTVPNTDGTKYNYDEVLMKSIMFYEAQRSGKLPAGTKTRIPWRGDSALKDQGDNGEDLTGGWYDAGDHVKFGFPMAASTTILAWSLLEYKDAYEASGQLDYMYDCIRWPLEWMLKCHTKPNELYVQVGDPGPDHGYWGRPEDMTMARPAYKLTTSKPGSDAAAEYAAAMTVSSLVFKDKDPAFSQKLLTHAKQLYDFAEQYKGKYSDSVQKAAGYYRSNKYEDELVWGAAWLYKATNESKYLKLAEQYYETGPDWGQSWDDKFSGNMIMLYRLTKKDIYKNDIEATFTDWMPGGTVPYTPKGLAYRLQWAPLRYAINMAFMAFLAADSGLHADEYRAWGKKQVGYALGDTGHSYVVGYGVNPPQRPHHRSSSCPSRPAPCSFADQQQSGPNPHVLYGALVGGPSKSDTYTDDRKDYVSNEVACDYNAGFQAAVADPKPTGFGGVYRHALPWLGEGLLIAGGSRWARSRRLLTPAFHFDILKPYIAVYNDCAGQLSKNIERFANTDASFEVFNLVCLCTLDIILRCAFSYETNCQENSGEVHPYVKAVNEIAVTWSRRNRMPWLFPDFIFYRTEEGKRFSRNLSVCTRGSGGRHRQTEKYTDLTNRKFLDFLDILLTAKDEDGNGLTKTEIRNEVDTFLFEGHDTTASAISWILYSLAEFPEYQTRCQQEIDTILKQNGNTEIQWEDVSKLEYLTQCIKEGMRLHVPVPFIARTTTKDIVFDGHTLPAGNFCTCHIWNLHHNPEVWKGPETYDPNRFSKENLAQMDSFAFLPFSAGPRNCIGQHFAMNEEKVVLAKLLSK
ncbi:hypothetical protein FSP39_008602 [Pinctada imbricata]|uniref:Endoglucanase n=1 Tax=Pinctada imbricata TaxID=66713 RepID=A0AA88YB56_PINIB|nr:hypothetical protein FSP39_008602 [Pinctada imbricata]